MTSTVIVDDNMADRTDCVAVLDVSVDIVGSIGSILTSDVRRVTILRSGIADGLT